MAQTQALLFDVDGTLLDTRDFILSATEHALATFGFPVPDRSIIANLVGKPFPEYYEKLTGLADSTALQKAHRDFQLSHLHLSVLFPNTLNTLTTLKERGYKLAVITTRSKITSLETLRQAGIDNLFEIIISGEDASEVKPHPAPLFKALEKLALLPASAVMIGDSHLDIQAGKNAGTKTIRATYGFHTDQLHETAPDHIINDIQELLALFP